MVLKTKMTVIFSLFLMTVAKPLFADEVQIKNGDRITGTIVKMEKKSLTVKTSYAGEIAIKWDQVKSIETDSAVHIVLGDKTSAHGILRATKTGDLQLKTEDVMEPIRFTFSQVEGINPTSEPPIKFSGRVNAGLDIKKGNTDTEAYHVDGEMEARTKNSRYTVGAEANREEDSGKKTVDNWLLYMSYDHFLTQKWFFYTNANFEQDDFKDLNLRTTVGVGSGYQFFESELINFSVRGGLAYVNADYSVDDQDNDYTAGRWAVKYDQYFFDKFFQFFHIHEGIVSLEDTEDTVIRARTGLRLPLRKGFNITLQYNWDWDNAPAPGKDRLDERYLFTLGYGWE